ncbi:STAS domain-containing protein [Halomicronema hongdechloris]|nr:STAS domain-containing protein [Halomicronema hongdechloris]
MMFMQPSGALSAANAQDFYGQMASQLRSDPVTGLVVDMSQVESLDSAGLNALASALQLAQTLNKTFRLKAVPPSIQIIFELTQLDGVFELADDSAVLPVAA